MKRGAMYHRRHPDPSPFGVLAGDANFKERAWRMVIEAIPAGRMMRKR
jgi:hypothetical protein